MLGRIASTVFALVFASVALFLLTRALPVSAGRIVLGMDAPEEQVRQFERDHGLDRPYIVQYADWAAGVLRGDFGKSLISGKLITEELSRTVPITIEIVTLAFVLTLAMALPLGIAAALWRDRWIDHLCRVFSIIGVSVPSFWLGFLMISYFAVYLRILPPGGYLPITRGFWPHLSSVILPAMAIALHYVAILSRLTRSSLLDVLSQDYIRTARAMGLSKAKILFYALKNALAPTVSIAAMSFGYMFGWAIIVEQVFNIAGLSRAMISAIAQRDYFMMQAIVMVFTTIFIVSNLAGDLVRSYLQPKAK